MAGNMVKAPLMISVSGVRGIVGDSLTADVALRWAEAFGSLCQPGPVVVGGDSRVSRVMMRAAAFSGLAGAGAKIIDAGIVPTPTIGLAVRHHRARGGIAITASHNGAEWNAFKFYGADGLFLGEDSGKRLRELVESERSFGVSAAEVGMYEKDENAVARHLEEVMAIPFLNVSEIKKRRFRVGLDAVCGAGGELLSKLLERLGCDVRGFHLDPTGVFPRNPEPVPENLRDVGLAMREANVEIGFVADPDADRLVVMLENGECAGEEQTLVAAADVTLRHERGGIVANCSTTRALDDLANKYNVPIARTKVGEAHVARKMIETGAVIGGEGNGGVMLARVHPARDAAVGIALILQALLESNASASAYFSSLPRYDMVKRKIVFDDPTRMKKSLERLNEALSLGEPDRLDGLKWSTDAGWVQARASNTEPIVRVIAEATERGEAERIADLVVKALTD